MASQFRSVKRTGITVGTALLLGLSGCAFPQGFSQGDPPLGSFNRPIVPTPPPERGGMGSNSPAYDAGTRIGIAPPDVGWQQDPSSGFMALPPMTNSPSTIPATPIPPYGNGAPNPGVNGVQLPGVPMMPMNPGTPPKDGAMLPKL
jgi:hypothetical protein